MIFFYSFCGIVKLICELWHLFFYKSTAPTNINSAAFSAFFKKYAFCGTQTCLFCGLRQHLRPLPPPTHTHTHTHTHTQTDLEINFINLSRKYSIIWCWDLHREERSWKTFRWCVYKASYESTKLLLERSSHSSWHIWKHNSHLKKTGIKTTSIYRPLFLQQKSNHIWPNFLETSITQKGKMFPQLHWYSLSWH